MHAERISLIWVPASNQHKGSEWRFASLIRGCRAQVRGSVLACGFVAQSGACSREYGLTIDMHWT